MQLIGLNTAELEAVLCDMNEPAFRGRQIALWIYRHGARSFGEMTNLSHELRARLEAEHQLDFPKTAARFDSTDGSTKLLLEMTDGERIECVRLPFQDRLSVCVSSQAGCAMACAFCATGLGGFRRNLSTSEIIAQVLLAASDTGEFHAPTNIVFMGMGEPLLNLDNVLKTIHLMHDEIGIPMRGITVSTVGILHGMKRLADENLQLTLAVSLHAPEDELRHRLIPTSRKTSVAQIVDGAKYYVNTTGRRVTFEYVVLGGVNDQANHAQALAKLCKGWPCHVNLIPWNDVPDAEFEGAKFHAPAPDDLKRFRAILEEANIAVTQRVQRGADVAAACGQLQAVHRGQPLPFAEVNAGPSA
jgi:23S rRNA (adenine2503-C2)-methyltransferase